MESMIKQGTLARLFAALSLGWRITLLTVKYSVMKGGNVKLAAYREDVFFYWIWRWQWGWNIAQQQWTVRRLRAYCPVCRSKLATLKTDFSTVLICPTGGPSHGDLFSYEQDIGTNVKPLILEKATRQFSTDEH